jgi:hypothetical protein
MGAVGRDKPRAVVSKLVFRNESTDYGDEVLRSFIDEWLVPALVEDYVRLHQLGTKKEEHRQVDPGLQGTESRG